MRFIYLLCIFNLSLAQIDVLISENIVNADKQILNSLQYLLTELDEEEDFDIDRVKASFTEDALTQFITLYENHRFIPNKSIYQLLPSDYIIDGDQVVINNIDLKNTLTDINLGGDTDEILIKSVNFYFDRDSKRISQMVIIDPKQDYKISLESGKTIKTDRIVADIKRFIEIFRTYYEERNISEIEKMYSDDAIIITGKRVNKVSETKTIVVAKDGAKYELSRQNKQQYIKRLADVFRSIRSNKDYLKIDFSDIHIKQHGKYENVFGVSLEQKWKTRSYSDIGDLFLIIDYSYPDTPQVRIRTWMPKDSQKFALYDFRLN